MFKAIGFDADDTLWHHEVLFQKTQKKFEKILKDQLSESWAKLKNSLAEEHNLSTNAQVREVIGTRRFTRVRTETLRCPSNSGPEQRYRTDAAHTPCATLTRSLLVMSTIGPHVSTESAKPTNSSDPTNSTSRRNLWENSTEQQEQMRLHANVKQVYPFKGKTDNAHPPSCLFHACCWAERISL